MTTGWRSVLDLILPTDSEDVDYAEVLVEGTALDRVGSVPGSEDAAVAAIIESARSSGVKASAVVAVGTSSSRLVGVSFSLGYPSAQDELVAGLAHRARGEGLSVAVEMQRGAGLSSLERALAVVPERIVNGWDLVEDCEVSDGRIVSLGRVAAAVRDSEAVVTFPIGPSPTPDLEPARSGARLLFRAGFNVGLFFAGGFGNPTSRGQLATLSSTLGFDELELAAIAERTAARCFLDMKERDSLAGRTRKEWSPAIDQLVHLASREQWEASRSSGTYLPVEFESDQFIHLSTVNQVLTPANRFYRGRDDLVALVVDATQLDGTVVWEAGTGTCERFPHLYGPLRSDAVLNVVDFPPMADGSFLLPVAFGS